MHICYKKYKNKIIPLEIINKIIPYGVYCHDFLMPTKHCPFWSDLTQNYQKNKTECWISKFCNNNCKTCKESVSKCNLLNIIEYGDYPLGDMCKICNYNINE